MQTQLNLFISAMTLELRYAASQAFVSGLGLKAAEFVMLLLLLLLIFCSPLFTGESNPCVFFFCEQFSKKKKKQTKNSTISSYTSILSSSSGSWNGGNEVEACVFLMQSWYQAQVMREQMLYLFTRLMNIFRLNQVSYNFSSLLRCRKTVFSAIFLNVFS